jgi:prevent-host-death family protein
MRRIGVRELRQDASRWLREVEGGETIEVTSRGRPVALLVPVPEKTGIERLVAEGRATRPLRPRRRDLTPRATPRPGVPPPSEILAQMREHER